MSSFVSRRSVTTTLVVSWLVLGAAACRRQALPELGRVPVFSMTDQAGKPVSDASLRGSVWAAAFIFTRCPSACPRVTTAMRGIQLDARSQGVPLRLVSFSVDPDNDTPLVLTKYAAQYGADLATWSFLTGDANAIRTTAEQGFKVAVEGKADPSGADFGLTHGTQLVLVDPSLAIRGYYSSSDDAALKRLVHDAARLVK
jgi:protein SCO1/2